jgi:Flp pilus assembly pilin Flp
MKFLSTLRNRMRAALLNNNRGQGATEYILLLVVVVGLVLAFKKPIMDKMKSKVDDLGGAMDKVTVDQ